MQVFTKMLRLRHIVIFVRVGATVQLTTPQDPLLLSLVPLVPLVSLGREIAQLVRLGFILLLILQHVYLVMRVISAIQQQQGISVDLDHTVPVGARWRLIVALVIIVKLHLAKRNVKMV